MSLKNILAMSTMLATMSGMPMYSGTKERRSPKEPKPLSDNLGFSGIVPKGHKTETVDFDFEKDGYELSISIPITFGTMSSRAKQIRSLETQLKAHINRTPINKLQEFDQFVITGELKKAPGGLSKFLPTDEVIVVENNKYKLP